MSLSASKLTFLSAFTAAVCWLANNTGGVIAAEGKTTLTSTALNNTQGQIAGNSGLDIHSRQLTNREGSLQSADAVFECVRSPAPATLLLIKSRVRFAVAGRRLH
ncbi:hypothetical protein F0L16_22175 [Photorhabdus heterorhabditis]|uniref:Filamentous hemagglutinin N-terminal domain-containing protein n=1 Tax=Photorhabdus heterorhabditis TaxID=880156 RepID=A0A5B0V8Q5_9GAMM|nr:hypothetical protein F0L16_22175 [Photorhabdus heterorhabditis]